MRKESFQPKNNLSDINGQNFAIFAFELSALHVFVEFSFFSSFSYC